jgi:hypothetical protein
MHDFGIFRLAGFRGSPTSMRSDPSRRTTFGISLVSSVCPILSADQSNPGGCTRSKSRSTAQSEILAIRGMSHSCVKWRDAACVGIASSQSSSSSSGSTRLVRVAERGSAIATSPSGTTPSDFAGDPNRIHVIEGAVVPQNNGSAALIACPGPAPRGQRSMPSRAISGQWQ